MVVRRQYPYMALTVWDQEGFGTPGWRGDLKRWKKYFSERAGYVQGDAAIRHADGGFTFHGRSDEVINVGGNRIGMERTFRTPSSYYPYATCHALLTPYPLVTRGRHRGD